MAKVKFSEFVEPELIAIWNFIAADNIPAADHFLEAAYEMFQHLAQLPRMGRSCQFPAPRLSDLRQFPTTGFEKYLIFYSPVPEGIEVLHVLHAARNLSKFFADH